MTDPAAKNLAAEIRAVEEGHRARRAPDDLGTYLVKSETTPSVSWRTTLGLVADRVVFECSCLAGQHWSSDPGIVPCKHAALLARRLERVGTLIFTGRIWRTAASAARIRGNRETGRSTIAEIAKPTHVADVFERDSGRSINFDVRCSCGYRNVLATTDRKFAEQAVARHLAVFEEPADPFVGL